MPFTSRQCNMDVVLDFCQCGQWFSICFK